jgi:hypothetical protein
MKIATQPSYKPAYPFLERKRTLLEPLMKHSTLYNGYSNLSKKREASILFSAAAPIIPDRYIWHLSYPCFREAIREKGIQPIDEDKQLVFANNQIEYPDQLWPLVYDDSGLMFNWDAFPNKDKASKALDEEKLGAYDFWRIDSIIAGYRGYRIDPFQPALIAGIFNNTVSDSNYICRKEAIPAKALKLFRYKPHTIQTYRDFVNGRIPALNYQINDGVVTLRGLDKAYPFFLEVVKNTQQKNQ